MKAMNVLKQGVWVVAAGALLAGCASSVKLDDNKAPVESRSTAPATGSASSGTSQSQVASVDLTKNANDAANSLPRIVYFDFDSFVVKDEYRPVVEGQARALVANKARKPSPTRRASSRSKATPTSAAAANTTSRSARSVPRRWPSPWNCSAPRPRRWRR